MSNKVLFGTLGTAVVAGIATVAVMNGWIGGATSPDPVQETALVAPAPEPEPEPAPDAAAQPRTATDDQPAPEAVPDVPDVPQAPEAVPPTEEADAPAQAEDPALAVDPAQADDPALAEDPAQADGPPLVDAPQVAEEDAADPAADPAVVLPSFDLVRAEPDGNTLVAGQGRAGAALEILVDGDPKADTQIAGDGKFVAFLDLAGLVAPAVLTLRMTHDGTVVMSESEVIIAPPPPSDVAVAEAAPEGTPVPEASASPGAVAALGTAPEPGAVPRGSPAPQPDSAARAVPEPQVPGAPESLAAMPEVDPGAAPARAQGDAATALAQPQPVSEPSPGDVAGLAASVDAPEALNAQNGGPMPPPPPEITSAAPKAPRPDPDPQLAARTVPGASDVPRGSSAAPTVLLSGPRGVEVLQTAPLAPGEVALDSISYDEAGEVLLSGRGAGASFVRVYLDNAPLTTARIREDGRWRLELPEIDSGTYTLRVDQLNEAGEVTARVESPFLRESAEVLEQAAITGPITSITVQPGNTLWGISRDRYGDGLEYFKVFEANRDRIRDPDLIYPGQIFDLPEEQDAPAR